MSPGEPALSLSTGRLKKLIETRFSTRRTDCATTRENLQSSLSKFDRQLLAGVSLQTTVVGAGRVPHVRLSVHPDFLSNPLALTNFMRLSLVKAALASVGGAPCRKSGNMGRKRDLPMLSLHVHGLLLLTAVSPLLVKALEGAAPRHLRPMYAQANMGHRPGKTTSFFCSTSATPSHVVCIHTGAEKEYARTRKETASCGIKATRIGDA
jgi:hypothetical protein